MTLQKVIPTGSIYNPTNSDIGIVSNYDANTRTFDISNITTTNIRNVLGEITNNVGLLCESPNVNQWALFRPIGTSPYNMGDFGGYNHQAKPPTYFNNPYTTLNSVWGQTGGVYSVQLHFNLRRGERWPLNLDYESWGRVKVKVTFKPTGYPEVVFWSAMEDVQNLSIGTTHQVNIEYSNITISGVIFVEAWYCNEAENPIQLIEGTHNDFTFTISRNTVPISISHFPATTYSGCRIYYAFNNVIDYISYDLATMTQGNLEHSIIKTSGNSVASPFRHPNNRSLINTNIMYVTSGGLLYRIELNGYTTVIEINSILRELDSSLSIVYKGSNIKTVGGYPTTEYQLINP